jgi:ATP-dependent RNA helicase RhlE
MQVHEQYEKLRGRKGAPAALVIGGMSEQRQIQAIRKGATIVVATPGRLEDYLRRKLLDLRNVRTLVLDEADRMLDMGFLPAIRRIVAALPRERQTLFHLEACGHRRTPGLRSVACGKSEVLRLLLHAEKAQTSVFARTKYGTERLAKHLVRDGFAAAMIHGDRTQSQRTGALSGFEMASFRCWLLPTWPRASTRQQRCTCH